MTVLWGFIQGPGVGLSSLAKAPWRQAPLVNTWIRIDSQCCFRTRDSGSLGAVCSRSTVYWEWDEGGETRGLLREATGKHWAGLLGLLVPGVQWKCALPTALPEEEGYSYAWPLQTLACVAACTDAARLHPFPVDLKVLSFWDV